MRVVLLSDTHMAHASVEIPPCDVLIHAGDFTRRGTRAEVVAFLTWFGAQDVATRLLIAGNHDTYCERAPDEMRRLAVAHGVRYLCDEEVEIAGLRVWGSPVTPAFRSMAFNRDRGAPIRAHWQRIPAGIDLLITHGPPFGIGDRIVLGMRVGCRDLLERVLAVGPKVHVFGHIHEARGEHAHAGCATRFVNASTRKFLPFGANLPFVLDL